MTGFENVGFADAAGVAKVGNAGFFAAGAGVEEEPNVNPPNGFPPAAGVGVVDKDTPEKTLLPVPPVEPVVVRLVLNLSLLKCEEEAIGLEKFEL